MKSFSLVFLSSLAVMTSAAPDHFQSVPSLLCTDGPTQVMTVTVTRSASPITITKAAKIISTSSMPFSLSTATSTTTAALAKKTIDVLVGAFANGKSTNEFLFKPNNVTANLGDVVRFNMLGKAHSVTQSQFDKPCIQNGTFDTQLQDNPMNKTGAIFEYFTVNVTTPLWFYCKQTLGVSHCGTGMTFSINPKSQTQVQEFINLAKAQNGTFKAPAATLTTASTSTMSTVSVKIPAPNPTSTLHSTYSAAVIKIAIPTTTSTTHTATSTGTVETITLKTMVSAVITPSISTMHSATSTSTVKITTSTSISMAPAVLPTGMVKVPMIKGRSAKPL